MQGAAAHADLFRGGSSIPISLFQRVDDQLFFRLVNRQIVLIEESVHFLARIGGHWLAQAGRQISKLDLVGSAENDRVFNSRA